MRDLLNLVIGMLNPADSGEGEARVNQVLKIATTAIVVLGGLLSGLERVVEFLTGLLAGGAS
jgi:hypothetical protein